MSYGISFPYSCCVPFLVIQFVLNLSSFHTAKRTANGFSCQPALDSHISASITSMMYAFLRFLPARLSLRTNMSDCLT